MRAMREAVWRVWAVFARTNSMAAIAAVRSAK